MAQGMDFEAEWAFIRSAFDHFVEIVDSGLKRDADSRKSVGDKMQTYSKIYNLCTDVKAKNVPWKEAPGQKQGQGSREAILYQRLRKLVEEHLNERVTPPVRGKTGEELFRAIHTAWTRHHLVTRWGSSVFQYLDQYFTKSHKEYSDTKNMLLRCFHDAMYDNVKADLRKSVLGEVLRDRNGDAVDRNVIRECINFFVEMGLGKRTVYEEDFERFLMDSTAEYYKTLGSTWWSEPGCRRRYLERAEQALLLEEQRLVAYQLPDQEKIIQVAVRELLVEYHIRLLDDAEAGPQPLLNQWQPVEEMLGEGQASSREAEKDRKLQEELGRMFRMFRRVPEGLTPMAERVKEQIKREGQHLNRKLNNGDLQEPKRWVQLCMQLHDKYTTLYAESMDNNAAFHNARTQAYEIFFNDKLQIVTKSAQGADDVKQISSAELLAQYVDELLKEDAQEEKFNDITAKLIALFMYLQEKDVFQVFYRSLLAQRLLSGVKSDSALDFEKQMVGKLKLKMGAPYTSNLESMLRDNDQVKELQEKFEAWCKKTSDKKPLLEARILQTGAWPGFKVTNFGMPAELAAQLEQFKLFYTKNHDSRVLKWVHSLGRADVTANFNKGKKEINMSTYQAAIVLLFNENPSRSVNDMAQELQLPADEVKRALAVLVLSKVAGKPFNILIKEGEGKASASINNSDVFVVNADWTFPKIKVGKIPAQMKIKGGDPEVRKDAMEKVDESRKFQMDAAVVRIMKSRRRLNGHELTAEVIKQLSSRFQPDPKQIKKRIEDLITRDYLERDEADRNIFNYRA
eukprot:TRINITY_DN1045_c0_g1_i1.p1 TRINITY_DN1045_c0_g1~~TRINITY_DN1045_c0_g1_i1.p1  ORF type:complete len:807 (-),score=233.93 TRINITY_DN1045_c0_g1_i1:386-2773(-)